MKASLFVSLVLIFGFSIPIYAQSSRKSETKRARFVQNINQREDLVTIKAPYNDEELEMPAWIVEEFADLNKKLKAILEPCAYLEILKGELFLFGDYKTKAEYKVRPEKTYASSELNELLTIEGARKNLQGVLNDHRNERVFDYPKFIATEKKGIFFRENFRDIGRTHNQIKFTDEWNIITSQRGRGNTILRWCFWDSKSGYLKETISSPTPAHTDNNNVVGCNIAEGEPIYAFFSDPETTSIRNHWFRGRGKYLISPSKKMIQSYYGTIAEAKEPNLLIKHKSGYLYKLCEPLPRFGEVDFIEAPWYISQPVKEFSFHLVNQSNADGLLIANDKDGIVWQGNKKRGNISLDIENLSTSYASKEIDDSDERERLSKEIIGAMIPAPILPSSLQDVVLDKVMMGRIGDRFNLFIRYYDRYESGGFLPGCLIGILNPKNEVYLFPVQITGKRGYRELYERDNSSSERVDILPHGKLKKYSQCIKRQNQTDVNIDSQYVYTYGAPRIRLMKITPSADEKFAEIQMGLDIGNNEERMYLIRLDLRNYVYKVIKEWKYETQTISPIWIPEKNWFLKPESDFQYSILSVREGHKDVKIADLYILSSSEYAIVLPNGFYAGSPGCEKFLAYGDGSKTVGMSTLAKWRNRPALVLEALGGNQSDIIALRETTKRWLKQQGYDMNNMPSEPSIDDIPMVMLRENKLFSQSAVARIRAILKATKHDITKLEVRAGGILIPQKWDSELLVPAGQEKEVVIEIPLEKASNWIEITPVDSTNTVGDTEKTRIIYESDAVSDLYIVSIGVSEYDDDSLNLQYAAKDAIDIAKCLERRCSGVKHILTLTNKEVHDKEVMQQIREFLVPASENDRVIMYIAGHGILDDDLNYFFAPAGFDLGRIHETGISMDELTQCLQSTKARKRLLLMDTCHSGVLGEEGEDKMLQSGVSLPHGVRAVKSRGMKVIRTNNALTHMAKKRYIEEMFSLSRKRGINIIAGSAGAEFAMESEQWNNGVFTACIMNSFNAAFDEDQDGYLSVQEIGNYVVREVQQQTSGIQTPSLSLEEYSNDFLLGDSPSFKTLNKYIFEKKWDGVKDLITRSSCNYNVGEAEFVALSALCNHAPAELVIDLIRHGKADAQDYSVLLYRLLNGEHDHEDSTDYCGFYEDEKRVILDALFSAPMNWQKFYLYGRYSDKDADIVKALINKGVSMASIFDPFGADRSIEQFCFLLSMGADPDTGVKQPMGMREHIDNLGITIGRNDLNYILQMEHSFNSIPKELYDFHWRISEALYRAYAKKDKQSVDENEMAASIEEALSNSLEFSALHKLAVLYALHPREDILQKMRMLLEWGADPNGSDGLNGMTPLHAIFRVKGRSFQELEPVVKLLLEFGADIMLTDNHGLPVLKQDGAGYKYLQSLVRKARTQQMTNGIYAPIQDYISPLGEPSLEAIIKCYDLYGGICNVVKGMPMSSRSEYQKEYEYVREKCKPTLINTLRKIQRGEDVNNVIPGTGGNTALHYACAMSSGKGAWIIVRWLINHGADVNAVNNAGLTPMDMLNIKTSEPVVWFDGKDGKIAKVGVSKLWTNSRIKELLNARGARTSGKTIDVHYFDKL